MTTADRKEEKRPLMGGMPSSDSATDATLLHDLKGHPHDDLAEDDGTLPQQMHDLGDPIDARQFSAPAFVVADATGTTDGSGPQSRRLPPPYPASTTQSPMQFAQQTSRATDPDSISPAFVVADTTDDPSSSTTQSFPQFSQPTDSSGNPPPYPDGPEHKSTLARARDLNSNNKSFHIPKRSKSYFSKLLKSYFYELLTAATIAVAAVLILLAYLHVFPPAASPLMIFGGGMMIVATALLHWTHRILLSNNNAFGNKWRNTSIEWRFAAAISIGLSVALILAPIYLPALGAGASFFADWGLLLSATGAVLAALITGLHLRHISQQSSSRSRLLVKNVTPISWKPVAATVFIGLSIAFILVPIYLSAFGLATSFFADWRFLFTLTGVVLGAVGMGLYLQHHSQKSDRNSVQFLEKAKAISWKGVLIFSVMLLGIMGFAAGRTSEWAPEFFASNSFWGLSVQTLFVQGGTLVLVLTALIQLIRIIKQPLDLAKSPISAAVAAGHGQGYGSAEGDEALAPSQEGPNFQQLSDLVATGAEIEKEITQFLDRQAEISIIMSKAVHGKVCNEIDFLDQAIENAGIDPQALGLKGQFLFLQVTTQLDRLETRQKILMLVSTIDIHLQDGQLLKAQAEILTLGENLTSFRKQFGGDPLLIEPTKMALLKEEDLQAGEGLQAALGRQRARLEAEEREEQHASIDERFHGVAASGEESLHQPMIDNIVDEANEMSDYLDSLGTVKTQEVIQKLGSKISGLDCSLQNFYNIHRLNKGEEPQLQPAEAVLEEARNQLGRLNPPARSPLPKRSQSRQKGAGISSSLGQDASDSPKARGETDDEEEADSTLPDNQRDLRKAQAFGRKRPLAFAGIAEEGESDEDKDTDSHARASSSPERKHARPEAKKAEEGKLRAASSAATGSARVKKLPPPLIPEVLRASRLASAASLGKAGDGEPTTPTDKPTASVTGSPVSPPAENASASARLGHFGKKAGSGASAPDDAFWDAEVSSSENSPRTPGPSVLD